MGWGVREMGGGRGRGVGWQGGEEERENKPYSSVAGLRHAM